MVILRHFKTFGKFDLDALSQHILLVIYMRRILQFTHFRTGGAGGQRVYRDSYILITNIRQWSVCTFGNVSMFILAIETQLCIRVSTDQFKYVSEWTLFRSRIRKFNSLPYVANISIFNNMLFSMHEVVSLVQIYNKATYL